MIGRVLKRIFPRDVRQVISNDRDVPIHVLLEPWADRYVVLPGQMLTVNYGRLPHGEFIEFCLAADAELRIWPPGNKRPEAAIDGRPVQSWQRANV